MLPEHCISILIPLIFSTFRVKMCGEKLTLPTQIFYSSEILSSSVFPTGLFLSLFFEFFYTKVFYIFTTHSPTVFLCPCVALELRIHGYDGFTYYRPFFRTQNPLYFTTSSTYRLNFPFLKWKENFTKCVYFIVAMKVLPVYLNFPVAGKIDCSC